MIYENLRYLFFLIILTVPYLVFGQDFYDRETIQEIKIYFSFDNWKYRLDSAKTGNDGYLLADSVWINNKKYLSAGVKFKGNSSYSPSRNKNPLHIKLDLVKSADYQGYDDIKLGNAWSDNSMIREPLAYEILRQYMFAPKSNFAKVFINNQYYGLMNNTESIDKGFLFRNFLSSAYSFIKCNPESIGANFGNGPNLGYLGDNISSYLGKYELESDTGWYELVQLCDSLNNHFEQFNDFADLDKFIWMLAFNNVLVNLDSYTGNFRQNYYLYRNHQGIWNPIVWDLNMCFGGFALPGGITSSLNPSTMQTMTHNLHKSESGWPLIFKLLNDPFYAKMYFAHMRTINQENFVTGNYKEWAKKLQMLVEQEVKNDSNFLSTYENFKIALETNTPGTNGAPTSPGIFPLMDGRANFLKNVLSATPPLIEWTKIPLEVKIGTMVNIYAKISNSNKAYLSYRTQISDRFLREQMYDDGLHGDGLAGDSLFGVSIPVVKPFTQFYFYAENSQAGSFLPERAEHEYYTLEAKIQMPQVGELVINELVPSNNSGIFNEKGKTKDWFELGNTTDRYLSLNGIIVSDDPQNFNRWAFPEDAFISPNDHLLVWADGENGSYLNYHTNFSLSGSAGNLILSSNDLIFDQVSYSSVKVDYSSARCPDLTGGFQLLSKVTPGAANQCLNLIDETPKEKIHVFPIPTNGNVEIHSDKVITEIQLFNFQGTFIRSLKIGNSDLSELPRGIYVIKIIDQDNKVYIKKISKL